jgi:RNA polymerase sigma-70 factor, ECF subfamily
MALQASPDPHTEHQIAAIYEEHYDLLVGIAVGRFSVPRADAETLAHEVFLDFLMRGSEILDRRAWLIGAIYNASKDYLRRAQRTEPLPEAGMERADPRYARAVDAWPDQLAARQAFGFLTPRCQVALRLRYLEGYTIPEIAVILGTTNRYATKLVGRCLDQAQRRYGGGGGK